MPSSRSSGIRLMPAAWSKTGLPAISIAPSSAVSSPARQRRIVVLPQPEGPSKASVWPASTASEAPSTATRLSKRLRRFLIDRKDTARSSAQQRRARRAEQREGEQQQDELDHRERRDPPDAVLGKNHQRDADGLGALGIQQKGGAELADEDHEQHQPAGDDRRQQQRKQHMAHGLEPGRAARARALLELRVDGEQHGRDRAGRERKEARHIGDQDDGEGGIKRRADRQDEESETQDDPRDAERQRQHRVDDRAAPAVT